MLSGGMVAAPQLSPVFSPLTFSLLLSEQKADKLFQTVPSSPSLSPLQEKKKNFENGSGSMHFLPNNSVPNRAAKRDSPIPALVPSGTAASGSPLQRRMLTTGRKRRGSLSSPLDHSPASPSPIATTSKRFCRHCSNVETVGERSRLVVLHRSKESKPSTPTARANQEQIVPNLTSSSSENNVKRRTPQRNVLTVNKDAIKELNLFIGDEIFVSNEE